VGLVGNTGLFTHGGGSFCSGNKLLPTLRVGDKALVPPEMQKPAISHRLGGRGSLTASDLAIGQYRGFADNFTRRWATPGYGGLRRFRYPGPGGSRSHLLL